MAKSNRPMVRIHNTETDEIIDREMNDEEYAAWQADRDAYAKSQAEAEAKSAAKQALLDRLGITDDEAKLLLS